MGIVIGCLAGAIPTWLWLRRVFVYQVHASSLHSHAISRTGVGSEKGLLYGVLCTKYQVEFQTFQGQIWRPIL